MAKANSTRRRRRSREIVDAKEAVDSSDSAVLLGKRVFFSCQISLVGACSYGCLSRHTEDAAFVQATPAL